MQELFRFVAAQGAPVGVKPGLISGDEILKGSPDGKAMLAANGSAAAGLALKFLAGGRFVPPSDAGLSSLLRVAASFGGRNAISLPELEAAARRELGGAPAELTQDKGFILLAQRLAESLLACRIAGAAAPVGSRGTLALGLRVIHALKASASESGPRDDVFVRPWAQMIVFGPAAGKPARGSAAPAKPAALPPPVASSGQEIAAIEAVIAELRNVSLKLPSRAEALLASATKGDSRGLPRKIVPPAVPKTLSPAARDLLQKTGLSLSSTEDFAEIEEILSGRRQMLAGRAAQIARRARPMARSVPGGSLIGRGGQWRDVTGLLDPSLLGDPAGIRPPGTQGTPGAPKTVGAAKVIHGLLMRVEDKIVGYEAGAIAKIANIPAASMKNLESEVLIRTEEVTELESSESSSSEQSVETEERFGLQVETENEISLEMSAKAAGGFSASYGPVSAEGSAEAATQFGMHSATSTASDYAKSVVEKAVSRLAKSKRELSRRTRSVQTRDLQKEGFDNTGGGNINAIYQWVDEVHEARLMNYGARMMLEFLVPQPVALLLWSMTGEAAQKDAPQPPPPLDIAIDEIEPGGLADLVVEYGATGAPAPPPLYRFVSKVIKIGEMLGDQSNTRKHYIVTDDTILVPEGYQSDRVWASLGATHPRDNYLNSGDTDSFKNARFAIEIGSTYFRLNGKRADLFEFRVDDGDAPRSGAIPIAVTGLEDRAATAIVIVRCKRTADSLQQWRLEVHAALQQAHRRRVEEYEDKLRLARLRGGLSTAARNPAQNRLVERDEIKRGALSILTAQHFEAFGAIGEAGGSPMPQIRFGEALIEGSYIQFFESAFEWTQTEYLLRPYFWANPAAHWLEALQIRMDDPLHEDFLRAGAARVVVPVRPGFEAAVMNYLSHPDSPVLWDGQSYEDIDMDSEMYFPIWREIMERQGQTEKEPIQEGPSWRFRIPTNHRIISGSGQLPAPP